jgi:hypothetical protein
MAHQSTTIPIRNTRNQPISWPSPEQAMPRTLPPRTPATANDIYRSSLAAAENSFHAALSKVSGAANSLTGTVRRFADERPLHFVEVVAGVAFVTGVALRIWRSKRYAQRTT